MKTCPKCLRIGVLQARYMESLAASLMCDCPEGQRLRGKITTKAQYERELKGLIFPGDDGFGMPQEPE